jgi:quercetin dioxygenase-like cupin family protein
MTPSVVITNRADAKARHDIALLGEETNGQISLRVSDIAPGDATPLHIHDDQSETFHVVHGIFRFQIGNTIIEGGPGFTAHIPKQVPHCFRYDGTVSDGQLISILSPGVHDGFIQKIPEAQKRGVGKDELFNLATQFGAKILGPTLPFKS